MGFSADITLVDFWYSGCGPCVEEMREFNALISGKENEINIVSISIDGKEYWKRSFQANSPLSFLRKETSNWKHYNITDSTFLMVEKELVARGGPGLNFTKELGLNAFPSYLVLDKNGVLIDLPHSGVDYIREKLFKQSNLRIILTSPQHKGTLIGMFIGAFVLYSVIYWTVILILLLIRRYKKKSKVANTLL